MNPHRTLRLLLLLPLVLWVVFAALWAASVNTDLAVLHGPVYAQVESVAGLYVIGLPLWFPSYAVSALGLAWWARGRAAGTVARGFVLAPCVWAVAQAAEVVIVNAVGGIGTAEMVANVVLSVELALAWGFACVVLGALLLRVLPVRRRDGAPPSADPPSPDAATP